MPDSLFLVIIACLAKDPGICQKWQPEVHEISELWCNYGGAQARPQNVDLTAHKAAPTRAAFFFSAFC